jgi:hypothetical protein
MNGYRSPRLTIRIFPILTLTLGMIILFGTGSQVPQQPHHDVSAVRIEVPVRVFDGGRFVGNLTMNDFEVFEDGVAQKVEAAYIIRKTAVHNNDTISDGPSAPVTITKPDESINKRRFVLIFEMDDYLPKMGQAIDMFFSDVLAEDDTVQIIAPESMWAIPKKPLNKESRAALAEELKSRLRKSLTENSTRLKSLLMDLQALSQSDVMERKRLMNELVQLKVMNVGQYKKLADYLKPLDGQKNAIIFYQQESYVIPSEYRDQNIHEDEIKKIFSDAGTTFHFLFLTNTNSAFGDFYQAFRNLADATGGISEATMDPISGFKKVLDAAENFYLVYYRPANYKADGKYKEIEVKVKGGKYRVTHRAGHLEK